jgi:hypothetical protein
MNCAAKLRFRSVLRPKFSLAYSAKVILIGDRLRIATQVVLSAALVNIGLIDAEY